MSLLPNQIPPQDEAVGQVIRNGEVQPEETVRLTLNWYLLLLNLVQRVIGQNAPELTSLLVDDGLANAEDAALSAGLASLAMQTLGEPPPDFGAQAQPLASVVPGASPFAWVAPFAGHLSITGGAVSAVTLTRQGMTVTIPGRQTVVRGQLVQPVLAAGHSATSAAFIPGAGALLLAVGQAFLSSGSSTAAITGSVGTYTAINPPGAFSDTAGDDWIMAFNPAATHVSQTVTCTDAGSDGTSVILYAIEYANAALADSGSQKNVNAPGAGSFSGTAVAVPPGAILCVLVENISFHAATITPTDGEVVLSTQNLGAGSGVSATIVEYPGTGATITPTFTTNVGADDYLIVQAIVEPAIAPALIPVCRGDQITVTYSSAPALTFIPWSNA